MSIKQKIEKAGRMGIDLPDNLLCGDEYNKLVGLYKFFAYDEGGEICFYIGKSTSIAWRLLNSSNGHIYLFFKGDIDSLVPSKIREFLAQGKRIRVDIEEVDYSDSSFSRAAHRLALAELLEIVKYQEKGYCLGQLPEGFGKRERAYWENNYRKSDLADNSFF